MPGIVAATHPGGVPVDPEHLRLLAARLSHRAGRATATARAEVAPAAWTDRQVGLLQVGDAPFDRPPDAAADARYVVVADARIDNGDDLERQLGTDRSTPNTGSARLILRAHRRWGQAAPEHLAGAFAYAIWDRDRRILTLVRDPIGIRPLFWARTPAGVVAASESQALRAHPDVSSTPDERRVARYLVQQPGEPEATFYRDVKRVRPAHRLIIDAGGRIRSERYWSAANAPDLRHVSDEEGISRFAEVFREAVRCRMTSGGTTGIMLSGGLDSSSVAAVARTEVASGDRLQTFSAIFPDLPARLRQISDERAYIRAMAGLPGIETTLVSLATSDPAADLEQTVAHLDRPPAIPNGYLYRALHEEARAAGVAVLLDGSEGDDTVSYGHGRLLELAATNRWQRFGAEAQALALRRGGRAAPVFWTYGAPYLEAASGSSLRRAAQCCRAAHQVGVPIHRVLWRTLVKPSLSTALRQRWDRLRRPEKEPQRASILHPDLAQYAAETEHDATRGIGNRDPDSDALPRTDREVHEHTFAGDDDATSLVLEEIDHLGARSGVEHRHPFYDVRLIELCVALPARLKLNDGWPRYVLRAAMDGLLPEAIRLRSDKADLSPNFGRNLYRYARPHLDELAESSSLAPFIDRTVLRDALRRSDAVAAWHALALARWLDHAPSYSGPEASPDAAPVPETF